MKKFDLHIHTIKTDSDAVFSFSLEKLKEYVTVSGIDVIAVTNHNVFDKAQYETIEAELPDCLVFPGIEVNYCSGHLLVIADKADVDDFRDRADLVNAEIADVHDTISAERFKQIFPDLSKYLLIPHYDKKPKVPNDAIAALGRDVFVGEVSSPKKFVQAVKDDQALVPVLFSDCRLTDTTRDFAFNQTYIDIDVVTMRTLKNVLHDRMKVALSSAGRDFINVNNGELMISTGLNVILGKRSSGKTHTLQTLEKQFGSHNIKYIHQFELLHRDEDKDRNEFDKLLAEKRSGLFDDYIEEFKYAFDDYLKTPTRTEDDESVQSYIGSLLTYAQEEDLKDAYSNSRLYTETLYSIIPNTGLDKLVENLRGILENAQYQQIIDHYLQRDKLVALYLELLKKKIANDADQNKKTWINTLVSDIKQQLQFHSASTNIEDVDFSSIIRNKLKRKKYVQLANLVKQERTIKNYRMQKFNIVAKTKRFIHATDMSSVLHIKTKFSHAFDMYSNPLDFAEALCDVDNISRSDLYRFFIKIDYEVLNEHYLPVSGGERSEFNLLQMIQDAKKYDMLLVDEPESSFDNVFLKNEVNKLIKEISAEMPVVIVTHNSTIGASISPDFIIYTKREIINRKPTFKIYYGHPRNPYLKSKDNEQEKNYLIQMDSLEAGVEAYNQRKDDYADLEN